MTSNRIAGLCGVLVLFAALSAQAGTAPDAGCVANPGDQILGARTPQVDLYDAPNGKRVLTIDSDKFPSSAPILCRAPNMMLEVSVNGTKYWVAPHMVRYSFAGKLPAVCRNLAMGSNQAKVGATRGLGEDCPTTGAH